MKRALGLFVLLECGGGCGGAAAPSVTVAMAPPVTPKTPDARPVKPFEVLTELYERKLPPDVHGIALDGTRLLVNRKGTLEVVDASGPVAPTPSAWKLGDPLVAVGDESFDPVGFGAHSPELPKSLTCETKGFSADASRMSAYCQDRSTGDDAVYVYDTKTNARLGVFKEFRTAAPIRSGTITGSGNFVFWSARASGAFEEISSHVTGPMTSSHSVMAPDEHALFTTIDRQWYAGDRSAPQMLDPKNARQLFTLPGDVDTVFFSPSGHLFAARHSRNWADLTHGSETDHTTLTIHAGSPDVVAAIPGDDAVSAVFSLTDQNVAVRFASAVVRVYALHR